MLKHIALALLFAEQLMPLPTIEDYEFGNAGHKVECKGKSQVSGQPRQRSQRTFSFYQGIKERIADLRSKG